MCLERNNVPGKSQRNLAKVSAGFMNFPGLDDSRVKFAADARHRACRCGPSPQMSCNEADAVRSRALAEAENADIKANEV